MLARCEFGIVGRSRGAGRAGSAVAASAYNLCTRLDDGSHVYDFTRKADEHTAGRVLLPPGAPPAMAEPGALWRAAEAAERRADAQLARQILISIPREVRSEDRLNFVSAIIAPYVADGMAAQLDVHCPDAADGGEQPHAHILLTLRRMSDAGLAPTKERAWNVQFREDGGKAERARVGERATAWLRAHDVVEDYDLRSLADRGDDRPPEPTAPRAIWQRWQREGADPDAAPAMVAAALAHRGRRSALARAEHAASDAAAEVAALTAWLTVAVDRPPEAESKRTGTKARPLEGAYTPMTDTAPTSTPCAQSESAKKRAALTKTSDHYATCRDAWRAELKAAKPDPRTALRARHKQERDRIYRTTRPGLFRAAALARTEKRQSAERVAARAAALAALWSAPMARETLDAWITRQSAAGYPAALALKDARDHAAAARARSDPCGEACRRVATWRAEAQAVLATGPFKREDICVLADATSKRATAKEQAARDAAAIARRAVRGHARQHGLLGGLLLIGRSTIAEHRLLLGVAVAAERRVSYAQADRRDEEAAVRQAAKHAERTARAARKAWTTGAGGNASDRLAALDLIQRAVRLGDPNAVASVLVGDERGAGWAAAARIATPKHVGAPRRAPTNPAQADPRAAALATLAHSEAEAAREPARLAAARMATAAAAAGDPATIAAAVAGDTAQAERVAAAWWNQHRAKPKATVSVRRPRMEANRTVAIR